MSDINKLTWGAEIAAGMSFTVLVFGAFQSPLLPCEDGEEKLQNLISVS